MTLYARRRAANAVCLDAVAGRRPASALLVLFLILWTLLRNGIPALGADALHRDDAAAGQPRRPAATPSSAAW